MITCHDNDLKYFPSVKVNDDETMCLDFDIRLPGGSWKHCKGSLDMSSPTTITWTTNQAEDLGLVELRYPDLDQWTTSFYILGQTVTLRAFIQSCECSIHVANMSN